MNEKELRDKVMELNMLKDYVYTPKNVILVTVDDVVQLMYNMMPYTMSRLDEARLLNEEATLYPRGEESKQ